MSLEERGAVTRLLAAVRAGNPQAPAELCEIVHSELRALAGKQMRLERPGHLLQPTALVNEVYLKLLGNAPVEFQDRQHFFRAAAQAMRRILVDHARVEKAQKRGGGAIKVELTDCMQIITASPDRQIDFNAALDRLQALDPRQAQVIELYVFGGKPKDEIAEILGVTVRTIEREIVSATLWLRREISGSKN